MAADNILIVNIYCLLYVRFIKFVQLSHDIGTSIVSTYSEETKAKWDEVS